MRSQSTNVANKEVEVGKNNSFDLYDLRDYSSQVLKCIVETHFGFLVLFYGENRTPI